MELYLWALMVWLLKAMVGHPQKDLLVQLGWQLIWPKMTLQVRFLWTLKTVIVQLMDWRLSMQKVRVKL